MPLIGTKKKMDSNELDSVVEVCVKNILEHASEVGKTTQGLLKDDAREFFKEKKIKVSKKQLENATATTSVYWALSFLVEPYLLGNKKYKESEAYKILLERVMGRIIEVFEGGVKRDILLIYSAKTWEALSSMQSGGPRMMWWDILFYVYEVDEDIPLIGGVFKDLELATLASETIRMSSETAVFMRKEFAKYSLA